MTDWTDQFPALQKLPGSLRDDLLRGSATISLPTGSRIYGPGRVPENFLLVIEGSVRVQQVAESGREIVLYRVSPGESCALTTACLIAHDDYIAEAIAETDVRAIAIPRSTFDDLLARSPEFRRFVFAAFGSRITDLFRVIDDIAFARLDVRLANKLIELSRGAESVSTTQQQLAIELGTAREVVSRILSEFQHRGWVKPLRGSVIINDRGALERIARAN